MTSDILNFKRFGKYLSSDLRACISNFGITFCISACAPVILYFFYGIFHQLLFGQWDAVSLGVRLVVFIAVLMVFCIAFPVTCYGKVTDKRAGSQFLMIPVSSFEKTASMLIIGCIIAPAAFVACYGALDALICLLDSRGGCAILSFSYLQELKDSVLTTSDFPEDYAGSFSVVMNPMLYVDDLVNVVLIFLLGALYFKTGKVSKTILVIIALNAVFSIVAIPVIVGIGEAAVRDTRVIFERLEWFLRHPGLADTISDTVINLALAALIFFRVKTIKH